MKPPSRAIVALLSLVILLTSSFKSNSESLMMAGCDGVQGVERIICLANAFKAKLTPAQVASLQLDYTLDNAKAWSNFPAALFPRKGLKMGELTEDQRTALHELLREASGKKPNEGWDEIQQVWLADDYLNTIEPGGKYGDGNYYVSFLGVPAMKGTFEILMTGHHFTTANTYKDGKLIGATPRFEAVEPYTFTMNGKTYAPINEERDAFAALLNGLTGEQLAKAKSANTFANIILIPNKNWLFPDTFTGLPGVELSPAQKQLFTTALATYTSDLPDADAATILKQYVSESDKTFIVYSGSTALSSQGDYIRIDGPHVWIELSVQRGQVVPNGPFHFHSIWRDRINDYGGTH
jgi:hypothetical protein